MPVRPWRIRDAERREIRSHAERGNEANRELQTEGRMLG